MNMLTHKGTTFLSTERLILRRFRTDDAEDMYNNWASDESVTKFLTWPPHKSPVFTRMLLEGWVKDYESLSSYQWAICLKPDDMPIGGISVVSMDENAGRAEIGYCIGKPWWGQGYTAEALREVIRFLFSEVGFTRIEAKHDENNPNSGKVMKKCGMRFEGIHRMSERNNQGIVNTAWYGILKDD